MGSVGTGCTLNMKNITLRFSISILLLLVSCNSNGGVEKSIQYTTIKDCKEKVDNDNAAFSELLCSRIGSYEVTIKSVGVEFMSIILQGNGKSLATDSDELTKDLPFTPGRMKVIEWHLENNEPKYMIFRLAWGTPSEPFVVTERLVIHLVSSDKICPLATINTKAAKNANQIARDLLASELSKITSCPKTIPEYPQ